MLDVIMMIWVYVMYKIKVFLKNLFIFFVFVGVIFEVYYCCYLFDKNRIKFYK